MIKKTRVKITDNSGGIIGRIIGVYHRKDVQVGDIVRVAIKSVQPNKKVKKGEVYRAIVVRSCKRVSCEGGSVRFGDNAVILLAENMQMIGTIVHGAVMRSALNAFPQILPLCEEVY
jgi:large subunit ribosomal protein L14